LPKLKDNAHNRPTRKSTPAPLGQEGAAVRLERLRERVLAVLKEVDSLVGGGPLDAKPGVDLSEEVRRFETRLILWALTRTGGNRRRAARMLNLNAATLNAKIKRYRIPTHDSTPVNL
jgi:DNA-binding NtrC family response regulator